MKRLTRLTYLLLASTILSGYVCANPEILSSFGPADSSFEMTGENGKSTIDYVRCQEILRQRGQGKLVVTQDLIEGKLTLIQAARWFKELNECPRELRDCYYMQVTNITASEELCLQVIQWATVEMIHFPRSQRDAVLQRLREQMRENRVQNKGAIVLPGT